MHPTLVILAAGMGSRYGDLKQTDPIGPNQETLLDYAVYDAIQAGFGKVVFLIKQSIEEAFKQSIGARYQNKIEIDYAFQELESLPLGYTVPENRIKPWGTGHAILCTREVVKEPFAVINADDFYGTASFEIMSQALSQIRVDSKEFYMVGFQLSNTLSEHGQVSRGICTVENGYLMSVVEREKIERKNGQICYTDTMGVDHSLEPSATASMNFWGFSPLVVFPYLEAGFGRFLDQQFSQNNAEYYIPSAVDHAIKTQVATMKVLPTSECWFGLTFPQDKAIVQQNILKKIEAGIYSANLFDLLN